MIGTWTVGAHFAKTGNLDVHFAENKKPFPMPYGLLKHKIIHLELWVNLVANYTLQLFNLDEH